MTDVLSEQKITHTRNWQANGRLVLTGSAVIEMESAEDARTAAAAPEMLEALKDGLRFIENTESELGITLDSGNAMRAAIAKAEGRS